MNMYHKVQAEFHAHDDEVDLEDFCDIMERHQPENLVVTNSGGSNGGDSDGEGGGHEHDDDPTDGGAGGRANKKDAGGGVGGGGVGIGGGKVVFTREEVISNLVELFKEVREFAH